MAEYMNVEKPTNIPARPGGEPRRVIARLVRMDGTEEFTPGRSVRYSGHTHVLVAVGSPAEYHWLRRADVVDVD